MKNFIKNILLLLILGGFIFYFQDYVENGFNLVKSKYFPCRTPLVYSLGSFDPRFDISKSEFVKQLQNAERKWEDALGGKDLFVYQETGGIKVNLIYDNKQEVTEKLNDLGVVLDKNRVAYDSFKLKYQESLNEYKNNKNSYEVRLDSFNVRSEKYSKDVNYWNNQGGADKQTYSKLEAERIWLNNESKALDAIQQQLNSKVLNINSMANELNATAKALNLDVSKFNQIGQENTGEFEEGVYRSGPDGKYIDIYQFENQTKLERVLAHEFGHALGLDHVNDKDAIMYELNSSTNKKLTKADLAELKIACQVE